MVKDILARSHRAVCAATEREIVVHHTKAGYTMRRLKAAGYRVIGRSEKEGSSIRIWFIQRGGIPLF